MARSRQKKSKQKKRPLQFFSEMLAVSPRAPGPAPIHSRLPRRNPEKGEENPSKKTLKPLQTLKPSVSKEAASDAEGHSAAYSKGHRPMSGNRNHVLPTLGGGGGGPSNTLSRD